MGVSGVVTRGFLFAAKFVVTAGYTSHAQALTAIHDPIGSGVIPFAR